MKFAYLILAHNNFKVLQKLVGMLDDPRNDIFIHFDKKVKDVPPIACKQSRLLFVEGRIDVRWGTYSQIQAYFELYREAYKHAPYDFYHLISGTTLPLKSQNCLHSHFEGFKGKSLLRIWPNDYGEMDFKLRRVHFGTRNFQSGNRSLRWLSQHFWTANIFMQKALGIRIHLNEKYTKSDCWASLSEKAVSYLLENEESIHRKYRFTFAGDEFYLATELLKNQSDDIVNCQTLLFVDFKEGEDHPSELTKEDFIRLSESDYLFARKFSDHSI